MLEPVNATPDIIEDDVLVVAVAVDLVQLVSADHLRGAIAAVGDIAQHHCTRGIAFMLHHHIHHGANGERSQCHWPGTQFLQGRHVATDRLHDVHMCPIAQTVHGDQYGEGVGQTVLTDREARLGRCAVEQQLHGGDHAKDP
jgi:hypothetical protein